MIERYHITDNSNLRVEDLEDREEVLTVNFKPHGFWYSEGESWEDWCVGENFNLEYLSRCFKYRVELREGAVLRLTDVDSLREFTNRYTKDPDISSLGKYRKYFIDRPLGLYIDWPSIAADGWAGVECVPYLYSMRCEPGFIWYSGWDVPSGCLWSPEVIVSLERVGQARSGIVVEERPVGRRLRDESRGLKEYKGGKR